MTGTQSVQIPERQKRRPGQAADPGRGRLCYMDTEILDREPMGPAQAAEARWRGRWLVNVVQAGDGWGRVSCTLSHGQITDTAQSGIVWKAGPEQRGRKSALEQPDRSR